MKCSVEIGDVFSSNGVRQRDLGKNRGGDPEKPVENPVETVNNVL